MRQHNPQKRKHVKIVMTDSKTHGHRVETIVVQHKNGRRTHIPKLWVIDEIAK